ncbi:MAG TPA: HupE/UreJ family protein [Steroidobacteraceae bacterium]
MLAALTFSAHIAVAHNIPVDARVQMFVKPEGHTLQVMVRVPLTTYIDAEYPRRAGDYVDLAKVDASLRAAATVILLESLTMYEGDRQLPNPRIVSARMSLDSDKSFISYDAALSHVVGPPLAPETNMFWEQGKLDVLFEYPIQTDKSPISMRAAFDRLAQHEITTVQYLLPNGGWRAFELPGDAGLVRLDPSWYHAAGLFVIMGFHHILEGSDHLLFLFCLVIPFRRIPPLIPIVTSFTVAHSITLIASGLGFAPDALWFPPLIEMLIAASIVYMALENIVVEQPRRRWIITFFFGLVHGFGFSFVLRNTLQFAGAHVLTSLLSFNVGVEIGQLFVLVLFVPALNLLFRYVVAVRLGTIILSALVAHQAWHWMEQRFDVLREFPWPTMTRIGLMSTLRWLTVLVVVAALVWVVSVATRRGEQPRVGQTPNSPAE